MTSEVKTSSGVSRDLTQFENFAKKVSVRVPHSTNSYRNFYGRSYSAISNSSFSKDEIRAILESGDTDAIRELSKYYSEDNVYKIWEKYYEGLLKEND